MQRKFIENLPFPSPDSFVVSDSFVASDLFVVSDSLVDVVFVVGGDVVGLADAEYFASNPRSTVCPGWNITNIWFPDENRGSSKGDPWQNRPRGESEELVDPPS